MAASFGGGPHTYELKEGWEQLPGGWTHLDVAALAVDADDRLYLFTRDEHPVIVYERDGTFVRSWGEGLFAEPHGIGISPDGTVYCVDKGDHTVRRFTPDGELVQTLGTQGQPSDTGFVDDYRSVKRGADPFHTPTSVAFTPSGDFYVADGYGNARIHYFSPNGDLRFSWGEPGTEPGEFNIPHAVAVAPDGRVFVADRENNRIEIFTSEGQFLEEWRDVNRPDDLTIDADGTLYLVELGMYVGRWPFMPPDTPESPPSRISIFDLDHNLLARWGTRDSCAPGQFYAPHGIAVDSAGDVYVSEVNWSGGGNIGDVPSDCHTLQKFTLVAATENDQSPVLAP